MKIKPEIEERVNKELNSPLTTSFGVRLSLGLAVIVSLLNNNLWATVYFGVSFWFFDEFVYLIATIQSKRKRSKK